MTFDIDQACAAARQRLTSHINRTAAQQLRRMREAWGTSPAAVDAQKIEFVCDTTELEGQFKTLAQFKQWTHDPSLSTRHQTSKSINALPLSGSNVFFPGPELDIARLTKGESILVVCLVVVLPIAAVGLAFSAGVIYAHWFL